MFGGSTGTLVARASDQPGAISDFETLQLRIGEVVEATLSDGGKVTATTPGEAPLNSERTHEICEGGITTFRADFTPVRQSGSGGYTLQSVADEVTVETTCDEASPPPTG